MDAKTAFLNGSLKEEVYVSQREGFIDPEFPDHVYRLKKALYGLKQAPHAWYDKLSSFLIEHGFTKGIVDPTVFTRRHGDDILLVQVYVDDIIFGSTNPDFSKSFVNVMKNNFEMSMMGELKFFLGLQVLQSPRGIFIRGLQFLGEKLVSWSSKKQDCTTMSTAEAEYVSLSACCAQVIWMRTQLLDYGYKYNRILMYCDSKSAIAISCNPVQHSKTKHIDIRYHFIKEHVEKGTVELYFVGTEYQLADLFTKALPKERFEYLVHRIVIIMAQQRHATDVHPDELCPPNKRYDLMDANKKVDFEQVQCLPKSKILMKIVKDHQSKYRLTFMLDKKMLSLTLDDFRTIFHLPQTNDNNHDSFVPPPSFLDMVPFYKNELGFTIELKTSSSFKTTGLLQPWQTLCKIFSKCLTTRLLWEGLYYSLHHPTSSIPYPRFTKIIISHYMTNFPKISRRARDIYHNMKDDDIMKNIFNSGRHKDRVGMKIPDWMISDEIKHTEHYRMYAKVFGIDVPLTQSQPTESTQGMHRTPSAPRSPNPKLDAGESSAPKWSTVIRFYIPQRRSTRLTPPAPVLLVDKADEMVLQDTLQVSLAEYKSQEEQEARENVELVNKHLASEEIEKMVDEPENVIDDSPIPRNDDQNIPDTRLEPRSDKESPEVEITNVVIPVNVNEEEEEITDEGRYGYLFEHLKAKFLSRKSFDTLADHLQEVMVESLPTMVDKHIKEQVEKQFPEQERGRLQAKISSQIQQAIDNYIPSLVDESVRNYMSGHILHVHPVQPQITYVPEQRYQLDQDDPHDDAPPEGENSAKQQKTSEYETYVTGESSGHVNKSEQSPSSSGNQEQVDDYDFWTESYASNDDEIPRKQVSQDIMEEVSLTINEAELKKIADEMLRQRCTSGDEHQYHIDQMKNFLKSYIVWESIKEILTSPHPRKTTPLVQSCQRDPEAPTLSMINQDLLYLKKENSGPEKIVLSLHKFSAIIFNDVDIEEQTSRWVNKCVKKFNPYARYGVEHWKNPHAKIFYIKRQKEPGKPKEVIVARRAKECIVIWERVHDFQLGIESYQQKVNLTAPTISFLGIEKHKMFSIIYKPMHGIIYKNRKREKKVMRHSEIHKFCDATLNKVLEGLKSYNNDVKYGYKQRDLTEDEVEYLKLFEEEIEVRLKYRNQMRR
ncbi:copia protein [Tanacetum coccineum]